MANDHPHTEMPDLLPTADGHKACAQCDRVIYSDPKLAAAAIIPLDGGIVLIKRAIEPAYGEWSFPSGYVNRGEVVEQAAEREALEETGLNITTKWLVGLYSKADSPVALAVYHTEVNGGELVAADEALDARVFQVSDMPKLAFEHDQRILRDWQAGLEARA